MKTIGIIGFGRFGKLVTKIIMEQLPEFEVIVFSRQQKPPENSGVMFFAQKTDLSKCDVVIPCVSISSFEEVVKQIRNDLKPGCLFMDVCSVKILPIKIMQKNLPKDINIIASHPLFGPDSANNGLKGLSIVLTNIRSDKEVFNKTRTVIKRLGLRTINMSPLEHDKKVAFSQVFIHLVSRIADEMNIKASTVDTMSFKQFLNIKQILTNDSFDLFSDMNNFNPFAKIMRKKFLKSFLKIERELS